MPRTRQARKTEKTNDETIVLDAELRNEMLQELEKKKLAILQLKENALAAIRLKSKEFALTLPSSLLDMKIGELKQKHGSAWQKLSNVSSATTFHNSIMNNKTNTKKISSDDGYLTSESSTGSSGSTIKTKSVKQTSTLKSVPPVKKTKRSISLSRNADLKEVPALMKTTRRTRSVSRSRPEEIPSNVLASSNKINQDKKLRSSSANRKTDDKYKTPRNRKKSTFGFITPKVKPHTPQVVFRRPVMGEMALSLQGSPLMTTAVVTETTANINIPLPDGRLMNVQPLKGLEPGELPFIDAETRKQLETLKENIDAICKFAASSEI